jgi:hypothetical protein
MNLTTAFLWAMIPLMAMALTRILYLWGRRDGINSERIKLYGNTLPRFENPPPPPPKFTIEPDRCQRVGCNKDALWRVEPNDGGPLTHILCCTDHMQERVDRLPGKPYKVTRIEGKEKKGVPTMPNHPPMPYIIEQVDQAYRDQNGRDPLPGVMQFEEAVKPHNRSVGNYQAEESKWETGYRLLEEALEATTLQLRATKEEYERVCKENEWLKGGGEKMPAPVTPDQLIDALMDMRLENFIAAHCKHAKEGDRLYYNSRKEVAEYLLDMYTITPKAKH